MITPVNARGLCEFCGLCDSRYASREPSAWHAGGVAEDGQIRWLSVPEVGERLGLSPSRVRRLLEERILLAVRREGVLAIPESFLDEEGPLRDLRGTLLVLGDAGYDDEEAMRWMLEPEDSLGVAPVDALRAGRRSEVRRVAQALAF
ncbi:MAG: hypothetical protein J0G30_09030 [Actinomycetales bacterium]|nr:hypothetical protein [Actinomycetales bacterium]